MTIISSTEYPQIRALLDVRLSSTDLSDTTIGRDVFVGAAEDELLAAIPTAASATGDDLVRAKRIVCLLTAARLAPTVVRITSITVDARDMQYSRQTFDPAKRAAELRAMAAEEMAELAESLDVSNSDDRRDLPPMFRRVSGTRGK